MEQLKYNEGKALNRIVFIGHFFYWNSNTYMNQNFCLFGFTRNFDKHF